MFSIYTSILKIMEVFLRFIFFKLEERPNTLTDIT